MEPYCQLCLWNQPFILFNDSNYPLSPKYKSYTYNPIINPNGYSEIPVCYFCLIDKIYSCDLNLKSNVLSELKYLFYLKSIKKLQRWWKDIIYNISNPIGKRFIYSRLSNETKTYFQLNSHLVFT